MTSPSDHALARDLATEAGELLLGLRSGLLATLDPRAAGRAADAAAQDLLAQALHQHRPDDSVLSEEAVDDATLAGRLAALAGEVLVSLRASGLATESLGKAGDLQANELLLAELAAQRPGDSILSEESADDLSRVGASRVWIIDPLDGTREYSAAGRGDWAVHVALCEGGELTAGAVALPGESRTLGTDEPLGELPGRPGAPDALWRFVVSRSRPPAVLDAPAFRAALGAQTIDVRPHGSAGAKTAEVVLGRADVYLHASSADGSGLNQWDAAAPAVVAAAAGLHVSHLDGSPLRFNVANVVTGDFLVCRPEIAAPLLVALAAGLGS